MKPLLSKNNISLYLQRQFVEGYSYIRYCFIFSFRSQVSFIKNLHSKTTTLSLECCNGDIIGYSQVF